MVIYKAQCNGDNFKGTEISFLAYAKVSYHIIWICYGATPVRSSEAPYKVKVK